MPTHFRLAELLDQKGITQSELARRSGVTYPVVNRMFHNHATMVRLHTLDRLAAALGVEPGALFVRVRPRSKKRPGKRR